jgi:glycerophosphoryl diester phosphodiesterase
MKINNRKIPTNAFLNRVIIVFFLLSILYGTIQFVPVSKQSNTAFLKDDGQPLVIAHRGGAGIAPENTLLAFRLSQKLGVDAIELDVRMTKDEELVVIHDATVDRTTNGTGYVKEYTLEEIKKLDAGYKIKNEKGVYPFRNKGVTVPSLEEVFVHINRTPLVIELKDPTKKVEKKIIKLIKKYNMKNKVIVGSFNDKSLRRFATTTNGNIPVGTGVETLRHFVILHKVGLDRLFNLERHAVQIPIKIGKIDLATERLVKTVKERNIAIHYWTINDEKTMKKLIELNVDGIITDYPNRLINLLEKRNGEI